MAVIAALVAMTMLGNLRLQASEVGHSYASRAAGAAALATSASDPLPAAPVAVEMRTTSVPPPATIDRDEDTTQLVPAIYAWDKDVRLVYFRHMSKWM